MRKVYINGSGKLLAAVAAGAALTGAFAVPNAQATMGISTAGSLTGVTSVPAPGNAGYVFWTTNNGGLGSGPNVFTGTSATNPTNYLTVSTSGDSIYSDTTYTKLTIGGTSYYTGVLFQSGGTNVTKTLVTLTFGTGTPSALKLGLLEDNGNYPNNDEASVTVQDAANNAVSASATVAGDSPSISNDFYFFDLSGLASNDSVNVLVTSIGSNQSIGGVTLDAAPEPTALGILTLGGLGLLLLPRKRAIGLI